MAEANDVRARMRGALWGSFVADAYCLGSHWIYDAAAFASRFPDGIEGFDAPAPGHYHAGKPRGAPTQYGEGARLLLASLVAVGGFDPVAYGEALFDFYAAPDCTSYVDKPTRHLLERRRRLPPEAAYGEDAALADEQNVTTSRLTPLVVRYAGSPALMLHVDRATRVLQNHDRAVAYACAQAKLLSALLAGTPLPQAVGQLRSLAAGHTPLGAELVEMIDDVEAAAKLDVAAATDRFGRACGLQKAFPAALHTALAYADDYPGAVRACAEARGDNASRAMLIGAWLGASLGIDAVPPAWRERLIDRVDLERSIEALLEAAGRTSSPRATH